MSKLIWGEFSMTGELDYVRLTNLMTARNRARRIVVGESSYMMRYGVMVAHQTLTLIVQAQILLPQPKGHCLFVP